MQPLLLMDDGKVGRVHKRGDERYGAGLSAIHVRKDGEL